MKIFEYDFLVVCISECLECPMRVILEDLGVISKRQGVRIYELELYILIAELTSKV